MAKTLRRLKTDGAFFGSGIAKSDDGPVSVPASIVLTFQNEGQLPITVHRASVTFLTDQAPTTSSNAACYSDLEGETFEYAQTPLRQTELKSSGSALVQFDWPKSCPAWIPHLLVDITYTGKDAMNNDFKGEDFRVPVTDASNGISLK